jgi:hypothetical protein
MSGAKKNFIGLEGFIWFIGVVEDRQDPEQLGRVRVRCFGWHTEAKDKIPTDQLPWAHPVIPVNGPNAYTPKEGDMVFGFFIDGMNAQNPAIMGILPGKPEAKPDYEKGFSDPGLNLDSRPKKPSDASEAYPKAKYIKEQTTNRLSRGKADSTVIATRKKNLKKNIKSADDVTWSEPNPPFKPTYPYNNALETESGHALEFDDTPGQERVHIAHRKGAYIEFDKDGTKLERVQKDNYCVIMGDDFIYVKGKASITVDGNFNLRTSTINIEAAAINMAADGAIRIKGKTVNIESTDAMNIKSGAAANFTSSGSLGLKGSDAKVTGSSVEISGTLNAGSTNMKATGTDSRGDTHNLSVAGSGGSAADTASGTGLTGGGASPPAEEAAEVENSSAIAVATEAGANSISTALDTSALQEVTVESKKIDVANTAGNKQFGKLTSGLSSTVDAVYSGIKNAADSIIKDFASSTSVGELSFKVETFAASVTDTKGLILGLKVDLKDQLLNKIDQVATGALERNIDFPIDSAIADAINEIKYVGLSKVENKMAKHVYPKTETVSWTPPETDSGS